jgi:hypothetical protein
MEQNINTTELFSTRIHTKLGIYYDEPVETQVTSPNILMNIVILGTQDVYLTNRKSVNEILSCNKT